MRIGGAWWRGSWGATSVSSSLGSFVCVVLASEKVLSMLLPGVIMVTSTFSVYIQVETRVLVHKCFCILSKKFFRRRSARSTRRTSPESKQGKRDHFR